MESSEVRAAQHQTLRHARLPAGALAVQMDKRIQFRVQRSRRLRWLSTISTGETFLDRISCVISAKVP